MNEAHAIAHFVVGYLDKKWQTEIPVLDRIEDVNQALAAYKERKAEKQ